jgi:hypothetical protein
MDTGNEMSKWRAKALEHFPAMRMEIEATGSIANLWVELIARLHRHYRSGIQENPTEAPEYVRAVCTYAIWCSRSESQHTQDAALVEFYEYFPKFALECPEPVYWKILADLVSNIGMAEVERMGVGLNDSDLTRFHADARQADDDRKRKSRKQ